MMTFIDNFLNKITMYRLVLYYLIILDALAAVFGAFGILPYSPVNVIFTAVFLTAAAWVANGIMAALFKAHPNVESVYITALILALIITPGSPTDVSFVMFLVWAAVFAMASKYILAIDRKHVFNPAALAVAVTALALNQAASWWVGGNLPLMAFVVAGGFLVVRKIQRFDLALPFLAGAFASAILTKPGFDPLATIQTMILHTPIFFFAAIMITEPLTTPPSRGWRIQYGALVGLLFSPAIHLGPIYSTPELALLAGNIFSYIVSPKGKFVLTLTKKDEVSDDTYDFSFAIERGKRFAFAPGQYLEWTLDHGSPDSRGNRRYFTIASSPTEREVMLGVKFYDPSSSFKKRLLSLAPGDTIVAGHLAGDFTLPRDPQRKIAFIAGGIGITPFRSMIKYIVDSGDRRDAVLLYSNRNEHEIAYADVFDEAAQKIGMKTVYAITGESAPASAAPVPALAPNTAPPAAFHRPANGAFYAGRITPDLVKREIPDYRDRIFYISGTHAMTTTLKKTLAEMGIPRSHVKVDFFPGFA